jgi:flagellar biosynthesis protein FliQ
VTDTSVIELLLGALTVAAKLSAPVLLTGLVVGFAISLVQSVTQIQEVTLSFVPKAVAVSVALVVTGKWMLHEITSFTVQLYEQIPSIVSAG